jgi:hypothetical protein
MKITTGATIALVLAAGALDQSIFPTRPITMLA